MKPGTQNYLVYFNVLKWFEWKIIVLCFKLRAKLCFGGFLSVFCTFLHKVVQNWFFWLQTWPTKLICICYCVEMVCIENNIHMLEIMCYVGFLRFFNNVCTFSNKIGQSWIVWLELGTQPYFVYIIVLKWLESKAIFICLKLRAKLVF